MDSTQLTAWSEEYLKLQAEIEEREARQRALKDNMKALLPSFGSPAVVTSESKWTFGAAEVCWVKGKRPSEKIERKLLVQQGVPPDVIAKATVVGKVGEPYIKVVKAGTVEPASEAA